MLINITRDVVKACGQIFLLHSICRSLLTLISVSGITIPLPSGNGGFRRCGVNHHQVFHQRSQVQVFGHQHSSRVAGS